MTMLSMSHKPLEVLIVGAGAVGSIFGAKAQTARSRVTTACRSNYDVAATRGIGIRSALWGDSIFKPDRVIRTPSEVSHVEFDYVVLATKISNQSDDAMVDSIRPSVTAKTVLVSVQNGITAETALRRAFGNPVFSSTCYISCSQRQPGIVEQVSHVRPHAFYIGVNRPGVHSDGKKELNTLIGLDTAFGKVEDAHAERWRKMIFNTTWSLSTSLMNRNTHEVMQDRNGVHLALGLANEAHRVGRAMGIDLAADLPKHTVESAAKAPAIVPSMLQDIRAGRPIEVEALCGGILRAGQEKGVDTPILESMYRFLSRLNRNLEAHLSKPRPAQTVFDIPISDMRLSIPALL